MLLSNLVNRSPKSQLQYAKMLNGSSPIFSQFGQDIFANDIVQMCIDRIATEISKLQPRHIRTDKNGMQQVPTGSLNRLFKFAPNPLMTTRDFLEKIIWLLYRNYNVFIYPMFENITDPNGKPTRNYKALYPLNPTMVTFLQDSAGQLFIEMVFAGGSKFTLAYADIIHLRKKFSVNDIMGGGISGQPDNTALLKVLDVNETVMQGLPKAMKSTLSIRGILKVNTMMDTPALKAEREKFETAIAGRRRAGSAR